MVRKATCCCGDCFIEVEGEPAINAICHCRNCKKRTGSAFGWSTYFADTQVRHSAGTVQTYLIEGHNRQRRSFCARCGTTLFWTAAAMPGHTGIAGGAFADHPFPEPSATVSNGGRCNWLTLPDQWRTAL